MARSTQKNPIFSRYTGSPDNRRRWKRAHHRKRRRCERRGQYPTPYDKSVTSYRDFSATGGKWWDTMATDEDMRK